MLIGMLWVSCRPIEFYLLRGLDGARTTTLRNRSVDERAVLQGLQSWNSYIWSQTATYGVKQNETKTGVNPSTSRVHKKVACQLIQQAVILSSLEACKNASHFKSKTESHAVNTVNYTNCSKTKE